MNRIYYNSNGILIKPQILYETTTTLSNTECGVYSINANP